jgi:hypothetical protein
MFSKQIFFSDLKQLLLHVPKNKKKTANHLLEHIEQRPSELTFDSKGVMLIDGVGIPGSNIFLLFPLLFKKEKPSLIGLEELINKLTEMKLNSYILENSPRKKAKIETKTGGSNEIDNKHWYYLGP